ncbi:MAG: DUF763 domain-containing protein [Candidatus Micrarchaeia archaeon]
MENKYMRRLTYLPLHGGKAPRWLFSRMIKLGEKICYAILDEYGADELLSRLADPNWFQALACALGYDWHSSGTTTVTMGALKEALKESSEIAIAGGKGKAGTNTPNEIYELADRLSISSAEKFVEYSRLSAKVDGSMVYDNISIYHHSFVFTKTGKWGVVQQAMENKGSMAIRFQWNSDFIDEKDFANEPHSGVGAEKSRNSMDLTYSKNNWARHGLVEALHELEEGNALVYPERHSIIMRLDIGKAGIEALRRAAEINPKDYKELLLLKGIGRSAIRSLAITASLIYEKELAMRDPAMYAYNVGGKDGVPFRISKPHYDSLIESMDYLLDKANLDGEEKRKALKRLGSMLAERQKILNVESDDR